MCLAVPGKVVAIDGDYAKVDFGGVTKRVGVSLLEGLSEDDYVIVHAGCAIEILNKNEAEERLKLFEELAASIDELES
ncbi:MAG: HypC/HybG/HupF family hydrogenase formation chaperone [Candidatus Helarchaeota archaeon]